MFNQLCSYFSINKMKHKISIKSLLHYVLWVIGFMHGDCEFPVSVLYHFVLLWILCSLYILQYLSENKH
jgi:hypothetical protein